jgi:hypothetical protein
MRVSDVRVTTRYEGATDSRGSRIRVSWPEGRRLVPFWHGASNAHEYAVGVALAGAGVRVVAVDYVRDTRSGCGNVFKVTVG